MGESGDVRRALQAIRDPLVHDMAYLDADPAGDPVRLRDQTDSITKLFLLAATAERLARNGEAETAMALVPHLEFPLTQRVATVAAELWPHDPRAAKRLWKTGLHRLSWERKDRAERAIGLRMLLAAARGRYDRGARQALRELRSAALEAADQGWPHCLLLLALAVRPDDRDAAAAWLDTAESRGDFRRSDRATDWVAVHALTQAAMGSPADAAASAAPLADEQDRTDAQALVAGYLADVARTPISSRLRFLTPQFLPAALALLAHIPPPGTTGRARELVASVLRTSYWHQALPALAALDPAAVRRARDALFDAHGERTAQPFRSST